MDISTVNNVHQVNGVLGFTGFEHSDQVYDTSGIPSNVNVNPYVNNLEQQQQLQQESNQNYQQQQPNLQQTTQEQSKTNIQQQQFSSSLQDVNNKEDHFKNEVNEENQYDMAFLIPHDDSIVNEGMINSIKVYITNSIVSIRMDEDGIGIEIPLDTSGTYVEQIAKNLSFIPVRLPEGITHLEFAQQAIGVFDYVIGYDNIVYSDMINIYFNGQLINNSKDIIIQGVQVGKGNRGSRLKGQIKFVVGNGGMHKRFCEVCCPKIVPLDDKSGAMIRVESNFATPSYKIFAEALQRMMMDLESYKTATFPVLDYNPRDFYREVTSMEEPEVPSGNFMVLDFNENTKVPKTIASLISRTLLRKLKVISALSLLNGVKLCIKLSSEYDWKTMFISALQINIDYLNKLYQTL
jgi:hypothetical protein